MNFQLEYTSQCIASIDVIVIKFYNYFTLKDVKIYFIHSILDLTISKIMRRDAVRFQERSSNMRNPVLHEAATTEGLKDVFICFINYQIAFNIKRHDIMIRLLRKAGVMTATSE